VSAKPFDSEYLSVARMEVSALTRMVGVCVCREIAPVYVKYGWGEVEEEEDWDLHKETVATFSK